MRHVHTWLLFSKGKRGPHLNGNTECPWNAEWGQSVRVFAVDLTNLGPFCQRHGGGHSKEVKLGAEEQRWAGSERDEGNRK